MIMRVRALSIEHMFGSNDKAYTLFFTFECGAPSEIYREKFGFFKEINNLKS